MTEKELLSLGFTEVNVSVEESGGEPFKYYVLDLCDLSLISCTEDECGDDGYFVEIFDHSGLGKYTSYLTLMELIALLKSGIK